MHYPPRPDPRPLCAALALVVTACQPASDKLSGVDTAESLAPRDVTVEGSALVPTVAVVRWRTDVPTTGAVAFGETVDYDRATPVEDEPATEHEALLLGLYEDATFHFEVQSIDGDDVVGSGDLEVETGALVAELPALEMGGEAGVVAGFMAGPLIGLSNAAAIFDGSGRPVWAVSTPMGTLDLRVIPSVDGASVLAMAAGVESDVDSLLAGSLLRYAYTGELVEEIPVPYLSQDFVELPDGVLAALVLDPLDDAGFPGSYGNQIVEIDADGAASVVWDARDHFDPGTTGAVEGDATWTHANALDYDPIEDLYYVTLRDFSAILAIERATGEIRWTLGGEASSFAAGPGTLFPQLLHQLDVVGDTVLIFDNGDPEEGSSRVVELELDEEAHTATQIWSHAHHPPLAVYAKGDVTRLSSGDVLITWSTAGELEVVDPTGTTRWRVNTALGTAMAYTTVVDSLYPR